jgi:Ca-activated chloride channel family protein
MKRFLARGLLVVCALSVLGAGRRQPPVFRGRSDVVRVFVTVTDRDGRLVTTLTQENFQIRDDGKPQPITLFDNSPQPLRLIVLLDVSGSMEGNLPLLRAAGTQLFTRLRPDDAACIGTFGNEIRISDSFTNDPHQLEAALPASIPPDAPTPLWRAVDSAIDVLNGGHSRKSDLGTAGPQAARTETAGTDTEEARSVILVLSDGKDADPPSFRRRPVSQAEVIDRAQKEDVMIYGVGMRSRSTRPLPPAFGPGGLQARLMADLPDPGLARVAEETGGGYTEIRFGQDLGAAFAAVADELHSQYLLGFAPPSRDGKLHRLDVRVTSGSLKPRARRSYVAPAAGK